MGNIKFEGSPPYALPIAQHVTARAEGAVVEMTLEVITPGKEPSIVPIIVQMTSDSARSLRAQLQPAITMAEVHPVVIPPSNSAYTRQTILRR